ncbi:MAG: Rrf2 family transcriptional regulator [Epsilonproteobacteria bacterium]|nr:Rrf2 family transcriptional regulator [Campylobacterota bacterium]
MLLTKASEYALLSLILISKEDDPVDVDTLSKKLNISKSFLAKILQSLARQEILISYKGAKGGFKLSKEPEEISVKDVIEFAEKKAPTVFECSPAKNLCKTQKAETCQIWPFLNRLQMKIDNFLDEISLKDIM